MTISLPLKIDNGKGIDYGQSCEERVEREDQLLHFLLAPKEMWASKVSFTCAGGGMQGQGAGLQYWHFNLLHIPSVRKALGSLHYLLCHICSPHHYPTFVLLQPRVQGLSFYQLQSKFQLRP